MKVLVLNSGSSSLKYQLIDMETEEVLAKGNFERIGQYNSFLTHKVGDEKQHPTLQINENVITINEIDRGIIKTEDGNDIVIDNTTNEELPVEEIENDNLVR